MGDRKNTTSEPKRCFVIMGFGIKTDFATGRQLDLNKSYKILIKPVVESRGLTCVRADEIQHSGPIDLYMYQQLLDADIVIADISTANVNAFYELGIRHALRRRTTIVISEDKLAYPFDLNHIKITSYTHLGGAIDYEEVERFRKVLGETIDSVLKINDPDSPVYTHLHELIPPSIRKKAAKAIKQLEEDLREIITHEENLRSDENGMNSPLAVLTDKGETALKNKDYKTAKIFFSTAISDMNNEPGHTPIYDPYLVQRLALSTYKAKEPDTVSALKEAIKLLTLLDLENTNDTETVTLAGKIEKRLYEAGEGEQHLVNAIQYYARGYYLFYNRYHGINLAFLLNKRVDSSIYKTDEDKIADMVFANRIRQHVLKMSEKDWSEVTELKNKTAKQFVLRGEQDLSEDQQVAENEQKFWILVNKAEAHFGLGEIEEYGKAVAEAKEIEHTEWMWKAFEEEVVELRKLLEKYGHLLNPPWKEN